MSDKTESKMKLKLLPLALLMMMPVSAWAENLLQVYDLAMQNDAQIRAARAIRDSALEARPQAQALLRPNVSLSANANLVHRDVKSSPSGSGSSNSNNRDLALSLSQPLYHRDYGIQVEQADLQAQKAEAEFKAAQQALLVRVSQAYFNVLSAQDSLVFAKAENAAIARQLDQAKQRFEVGLIAITSVHEAQAAFDQSRADLIAAENALDNAKEALHEITKQTVGELSPVIDDLPLNSPVPQSQSEWADAAQQQNLSIESARLGAEIARKKIEVERSGNYPTLDLVGSHSFDRNSSSSATDADTTTVGLQLSVPLYTGGAVTSKTKQATLDFEAAKENLDGERRSVNRQVRDAFRGVNASISTVKALKASTVSAQSALEATEAGFEVGTRTMVDVLNAQRDLFQARSNYSRVRYDYIMSGLELKRAGGILAKDDLEQVNTWLK
jgi:outer membrane protein